MECAYDLTQPVPYQPTTPSPEPTSFADDRYPEEREVAMEHLEFAISEFEEMKMKPSLEKAQALRERTAG